MKQLSAKRLTILLCSIAAIMAWCLVIFNFSATPSRSSNGGSIELTKKLISQALDITDKINHTDSNISEDQLNTAAQIINKPLRKVAHATIYCILALILLTVSRIAFGGRLYLVSCLLTILFCVIFAMTDEYHQTFVAGRTGQFSDVLVDAFGACAGILLFSSYYFAWRIGNNTHDRIDRNNTPPSP